MQIDFEDVNVTKLVDIISRILKHLDLDFYYFFKNFYAFSKFAVLSSSTFCRLDPGTLVSFIMGGPWPTVQNRGGTGGAVFGEDGRWR